MTARGVKRLFAAYKIECIARATTYIEMETIRVIPVNKRPIEKTKQTDTVFARQRSIPVIPNDTLPIRVGANPFSKFVASKVSFAHEVFPQLIINENEH